MRFYSCQSNYCLVMPWGVSLQVSIIDFSQMTPIVGSCERDERQEIESRTYEGHVVVVKAKVGWQFGSSLAAAHK